MSYETTKHGRIVHKCVVSGTNFEEKLDAFVKTVWDNADGNVEDLVRALAMNIMVRDMILDLVFNVSEERREELVASFMDHLDTLEKEGK